MKHNKVTVVVPSKGPWKDGQLDKEIAESKDINPDGRPVIPLTEVETLYHMERVQRCNPLTYGMLRLVFPGLPEEPELDRVSDSIRQYSKDIQHIGGLIELTLAMAVKYPGILLNWKYPETYLHPGNQCGLGDLMSQMRGVLDGMNGDGSTVVDVATVDDDGEEDCNE